VPIRDPEVEKKIHQTYRLQYLKDVVLARILDDPTFSVLNSLIFFNQFDILQHLQSNQTFMTELFSIFRDPEAPASRKKMAILFIQNCCSIAKSIQVQARMQLYSNFIHNGLFCVIDYALMEKDPSVRIAGTDVLVAMIDHDPAMMRAFIYRQINEKQKPLTHTLIELLLGEQDLGVKAQIADAIRVLLDHSQGTPLDNMGKMGDMAARLHARSTAMDSETEGFLKNFYEESAKKLFAPLKELQGRESCMFSGSGNLSGSDLRTVAGLRIAEVSLYSHLVETLCFFVRQHSYRSKYFLLTENLPSRVAQLLQSPEKHLKLIALKFFRTCVGLQDEFYIRHMVKYKLFEPILNLVIETMPRDNLLNSACLEFFEFIRRVSSVPAVERNALIMDIGEPQAHHHAPGR
jgi:protein phosphatase-4 regulatory subunit 3